MRGMLVVLGSARVSRVRPTGGLARRALPRILRQNSFVRFFCFRRLRCLRDQKSLANLQFARVLDVIERH